MRRSVGCLCAGLLVIGVSLGFGDGRQNSAWLAYEKGNAAMAAREYGQALQLYKEAIAQAGVFPEAEIGLGDIYFEEGEIDLSLDQYKKAYDMRKSFYIPDEQYSVLYKIAHVYEAQSLYKRMEDSLGVIEAADPHYVETDTFKLRTQVEKMYREKGINRVLTLYSFDDTLYAPAHSKLGWFYYRTGRFTQGTSELLFSVIYRVGAMTSVLRQRDVEYGFTTLDDFLGIVEKNADLREYAATYGLYKDLYYLAGTTFAEGLPAHAVSIWKLLAGSATAGTYQDLARRQVKKPWIEPLITGVSVTGN
jgi:tetratricopeptide (TPR) repeat protein